MIWSFVLTTSYVAILYLYPPTRPSLTVSRDDPTVIRDRMVLISLLTVLLGWLSSETSILLPNLSDLHSTYRALGLTMTLFAGPLFETLVEFPSWEYLKTEYTDIYALRNFIVGPVTEELVFRAFLIDSLKTDPWWSFNKLIFVSPLFFGIAHIHHMYESYLHSRNFLRCMAMALFHTAFTTVFGWYAAWLYLTTGSVYSSIAAHIFCNIMGLPSLSIDKYNLLYQALLVAGLGAFIYALELF